MEIFFCDICNESVPEGDLNHGLAYRRGNRVVCAPCDRAMSHADGAGGSVGLLTKPPKVGTDTEVEAAAPPIQDRKLALAPTGAGSAASGAGGILIALLVLVFGAAGFALMLEKLDELDERTDNKVAGLRGQFGGIRDSLGQHDLLNQERLTSAEARIQADRVTALSSIQAGIEGLRAQITANDGRFESIAGDLQQIRADQSAGLSVLEGQVSALGQQLLDVERSARDTGLALANLEESFEALLLSPGALSAPAIGSGEVDPDGGKPPWDGLLADLAHSNSGLRLDAVYALGETKDSRVVPHLLPMLKDEDLFVRMATSHVLVDLNAKLAVPNLIDTLEDDSSPVREAAMVALRDLTNQNFQFEPLGSESARKKRVAEWRNWWKRNGDDFLTGSA
tara:strand:- start:5504 stop:6688 length:1185 start_codon:yes stop_codon:yes gene_type:complete